MLQHKALITNGTVNRGMCINRCKQTDLPLFDFANVFALRVRAFPPTTTTDLTLLVLHLDNNCQISKTSLMGTSHLEIARANLAKRLSNLQ